MSPEARNPAVEAQVTGWNPKDWKKSLDTERKLRWQRVFQVGEFTPYQKKEIKWDSLRNAWYASLTNPAAFLAHVVEHIRKIDIDLRGGKDIGGAKERLERVGALIGVIALFTAFDYATSKPFEKLFPIKTGQNLTQDEVLANGRMGAIKKIIEVMNDKYATALGNMLVEKLSGKRGFIHEVADKGADTLQVGFDEINDWVNGATLESYLRILYQVPVAGALFEQAITRLAMLQEKSSIHTATGKMLYMGLGVFIRDTRKASKMSEAELANVLARVIT